MSPAAKRRAPRCSIVIPVHNKAGLTARCLDAILAEPPRVTFEIVVVDDASTDRTARVLERYGDQVRPVRLRRNAGFATACNRGARESRGELLVFLNNDTVPTRGWLDALVRDADRHPGAAVIGAKLLFPNETVQHAGVVICQDGWARHLYAGFPADHPAVSKSRPFQAVTAACMLVRRKPFEAAGGFDRAFRNSLEDADLCLRLGEMGHEVRLCHRSVLYHLESVSRGRRSKEIEASQREFRRRWAEKAPRDDVRFYIEDGLMSIGYRDGYPLVLEVSPLLASLPAGQDGGRMIELQAAQVAALLRETVRLTAHVAELELDAPIGNGKPPAPVPSNGAATAGIDPDTAEELADEVARIEDDILELQTRVGTLVRKRSRRGRAVAPLEPGPMLSYNRARVRLRQLIRSEVPKGATVLVVSRGDAELLQLGSRTGWHFPREEDGTYSGHHPESSDAAIALLERLRAAGAGWLAIPVTSLWWLRHYRKFARHLRDHGELVADDAEAGRLWRLRGPA